MTLSLVAKYTASAGALFILVVALLCVLDDDGFGIPNWLARWMVGLGLLALIVAIIMKMHAGWA